MDDRRFDSLTRVVGTGWTRRGTVRAALGVLGAAVVGGSTLSPAEAKKNRSKQAKAQTDPGGEQCPSHECHDHYDCSRPIGAQTLESPCRCFHESGNPAIETETNGYCGKCKGEREWAPSREYCCNPDEYCEETGKCGRCECSCRGKDCGDENGCGRICGGCPDHQICVVGRDDFHCKPVPTCAPNGEPGGLCCSGYHKDGICCPADTPGAISILVKVDVYNSITVETPPSTVPVITLPAASSGSSSSNSSQKKRRRRRRRGGRRR
jgi:hypothetical protein